MDPMGFHGVQLFGIAMVGFGIAGAATRGGTLWAFLGMLVAFVGIGADPAFEESSGAAGGPRRPREDRTRDDLPPESVAFADLPHPLDLALNDFGLADVPAGIETPRDKGQALFRDRLGVLEIRSDSDDRQGPRRRRVEMSALLVDARIEQPRPRPANALLVDLELLPRLRMRAVSHRDDVLAHRGLAGERDHGRKVSRGKARADFEEIGLENRQDVHRFRVREPDVVLQELRTVF